MSVRPLVTAASVLLLTAPAAWATEWQVDPAKSSLAFSGVQLGSRFTGRFDRFQAEVAFDPDNLQAAHVEVRVDLASARTGDVQRDEAMPQKDWFDISSSREARFEATQFVDQGRGDYRAVGTLTIRGVSRPLTLPFHLTLDAGQAHATGHVDLVRTEFGVGQGAWASSQWVGLDVAVDVDIGAKSLPAAGDKSGH